MMAGFTVGIVSSLVANALSAVARHLLPPVLTQSKQEQALAKLAKEDPPLAALLDKAVMTVAKSVHFRNAEQTERLQIFLSSPEAETSVRQTFGLFLSSEPRVKALGAIREEFVCSLLLYLGTQDSEATRVAEALFDAVAIACDRMLIDAIKNGAISAHAAHEARSSLRNAIFLDEFAALRKNLEFLQRGDELDPDSIIRFEASYRTQVINRHGYITPPHFDVARKIPIQEICVPPKFSPLANPGNKAPSPITFDQFLSNLDRSVVIGNPGGGKSTLAAKICHDVGARYADRILGGRQLTAILVVLRDYGAAKKEHGHSIVQFIEATANSHYQLRAPQGAIEYILRKGRAIVIFDGLDELLETRHRVEISGDIESFCNLYPSAPILVTSREVGYEQAPLDEKRFAAFRLAPFDNEQVAEYVTKWFAIDHDLSQAQRQQKTAAFLGESAVVADLRSNPLMLALMCNIYRGENYIPRNRPDVYEKCATMLFERWDKSRGILVPLPFEAHISPAMKFLAHWIYSDDKLQAGVTEEVLTNKATEYLCPRRFDDIDEARKAAGDFIEFCTGRAWVFSDTGTTKTGERLYQFTHRTFLEYFTAAHLVRTNPVPESLRALLIPRITKREWDVVAQLAFQLQNKQAEGAADELLTALMAKAKESRSERLNLLSFAARSLEFLVPSPRITREVAQACLDETFSELHTIKNSGKPQPNPHPDDRQPAYLIASLLSSTSENWGPIGDRLEKDIIAKTNAPDRSQILTAIDLGLNLQLALHMTRMTPDCRSFAVDLSDRIWTACSETAKSQARADLSTCVQCYYRRAIPLSSLREWHGVDGLFRLTEHHAYPSFRSWSVAGLSLISLVFEWPQPQNPERFSDIALLGEMLLKEPPPWVTINDQFDSALGNWVFEPAFGIPRPVPSEEALLFTGFVLAAIQFEALSLKRIGSLDETGLLRAEVPLLTHLRPLLSARIGSQSPGELDAHIERMGFSVEHAQFIRAWTERVVTVAAADPRQN